MNPNNINIQVPNAYAAMRRTGLPNYNARIERNPTLVELFEIPQQIVEANDNQYFQMPAEPLGIQTPPQALRRNIDHLLHVPEAILEQDRNLPRYNNRYIASPEPEQFNNINPNIIEVAPQHAHQVALQHAHQLIPFNGIIDEDDFSTEVNSENFSNEENSEIGDF